MSSPNSMADVVRTIAEAICDKPDVIKVTEIESSASSTIDVRVAKEDLGKMIGKGGETASAIRRIMYASSFKFCDEDRSPKRYNLDITAQ